MQPITQALLFRKWKYNRLLRVCHASMWVIGCFSVSPIRPPSQNVGGATNSPPTSVQNRDGRGARQRISNERQESMGTGLTFDEYIELTAMPLTGADPIVVQVVEEVRERLFSMPSVVSANHRRATRDEPAFRLTGPPRRAGGCIRRR